MQADFKTEKEFETWFVKECKKHGILPLKMTSLSFTGCPDRLLICQKTGHKFWVELKNGSKHKMTNNQKAFDKMLGGEVMCVRNKKETSMMFDTIDYVRECLPDSFQAKLEIMNFMYLGNIK